MKAQLITAASFVLALSGGVAFAGSSFQQTCSNIQFAYSGNDAALQATCLRADGTPNASSLIIKGISNQNGKLVGGGNGNSSFQKSCGNIHITLNPHAATLHAFCRTASGASKITRIELNGISNQNGNLTY